MTIAEARARCAELRVAVWDEDTIARAVLLASAAFVQASPQVAPAPGPPGTWWIGVNGLEALGGEPVLAQRLLALARQWHPDARVGIADSCVAARAATWATGGATGGATESESRRSRHAIVIVPPGGCAAYLAPAPLGLVPMEEELRETLRALGVGTVGAFAALAAEDVERRWGASGVAAWRLARGDDERRPVLARLDRPRAVATDLHPSVPTMEPILFLIRAALDRLIHDLIQDGRAAAVLTITLALDDVPAARAHAPPAHRVLATSPHSHTVTREIRLPRPLARVVPLLERCRALLDGWVLHAPVCGVTVAVTATTALQGAQGELLDPGWRDPAAVDAAFARLRSALGTGAVVRPVVRDTHRPERVGVWERVDGTGDDRGTTRGDARPAPPHLHRPPPSTLPYSPALRQLDPPERAEVATSNGTPHTISWRQHVFTVTRAIGPERLTGDWWDAPYARDYWRCEDSSGTADLILYRDCTTPAPTWCIHGWYD